MESKPQLDDGWKGYLTTRSSNLVQLASARASFLDAVSYPITLLHLMEQLQYITDPAIKEIHILVIGASRKAEQRVYQSTNYWQEIGRYYSDYNVHLWMIGPEVDPSSSDPLFHPFQGTFLEFYHSNSSILPPNSLIVGFNTGFGNFVESKQYDLLWSWMQDLYLLASLSIPVIFTCANDYADMNGEFQIQTRIIGSKFIHLPKQNPFSAASHLHEKNQRETAWSRANSFYYIISGFDLERRRIVKTQTELLHRLNQDMSVPFHWIDALERQFIGNTILAKDQYVRTVSQDKMIQVSIGLPETIQNMQQLELIVSNQLIVLKYEKQLYPVSIQLPRPVDPAKVKAVFRKQIHQLDLQLHSS